MSWSYDDMCLYIIFTQNSTTDSYQKKKKNSTTEGFALHSKPKKLSVKELTIYT